jgi:ABC-type Fe3+ transport system permease subunit
VLTVPSTLAIAALAVSRGAGPDGLGGPAEVALLAVAAALAAQLLPLAYRALRPSGQNQSRRLKNANRSAMASSSIPSPNTTKSPQSRM